MSVCLDKDGGMKVKIQCFGCKKYLLIPKNKKGRAKCPYCSKFTYVGITPYQFRATDDLVLEVEEENVKQELKKNINNPKKNKSSQKWGLNLFIIIIFSRAIVFQLNSDIPYSASKMLGTKASLTPELTKIKLAPANAISASQCPATTAFQFTDLKTFIKNHPLPPVSEIKNISNALYPTSLDSPSINAIFLILGIFIRLFSLIFA